MQIVMESLKQEAPKHALDASVQKEAEEKVLSLEKKLQAKIDE
jgi:hypothetical protein